MAGTIRNFLAYPSSPAGRQGITLSGRRYTRVYYLTPEARRKPQPTAKIFVPDITPQAKGLGVRNVSTQFFFQPFRNKIKA
jgi:hypothetical protein